MTKTLFPVVALFALVACGDAIAQGKALNNNPNLATLAQQIEAAKITGSCGDGSYLAGIAADGSLICKTFTNAGVTLTVVSQSFNAAPNTIFSAVAVCPVGEKATGGGVQTESAPMRPAYPLIDGSGFKLEGKSGGAGASGTLYAICLK